MRASRLLSILMALQARGGATAEALAAELEVSVRTIYRDLDELSASGVPVYADRGPGGGFRLRDGYRTQLTGLSADEAESLVLAGLPGPAAQLGLGAAMASAERKLLAALPAGHAARATRARQRVLLDPLDWYRRAEHPPALAAVARAVWGQRRIAVRYEGWTRTAEQVLEPLGLVIKAGRWYVVARRAGAIRTYKVSQILALTPLDEPFAPPAGFQLADHWARELVRFERELRRGRATLRVAPGAMARIDRLGAEAADAVRAAPADEAGWRTAEIPLEGHDHAARELLGLGPDVVVIAPAALADLVRDLAKQTAARYRGRRRARPAQASRRR